MNFYKRYMGDFSRDTAHLTMLERGAYNDMLDYYYATEKPLPAAKEALYRIARAMNGGERRAVDRIAEQFFPVNSDGLRHNKRADREIAKHEKQAATNREQGKKGGRPKTDSLTEPETESVSETKPNGNPNQIPDKSKAAAPSGALDAVWGPGLQALLAVGVPECQARSFIGALLGSWSEIDVLEAIQASSGKVDPRSYVRGVLKTKPKKGEEVKLKVAL